MKKILLLLLVICFIPFPVFGDPVNATFQWEQSDYDKVNYWILYWGAASGGPYDVGSVQIDKTILDVSQSAPVVIEYPADAKTRYYFVLVAFVDPDHYSGNSNEIDLEVDFIYVPGTPLNLNVVIVPAGG